MLLGCFAWLADAVGEILCLLQRILKLGGGRNGALNSHGQVTAHSSACAKEQSELKPVENLPHQGNKQHGLTGTGC